MTSFSRSGSKSNPAQSRKKRLLRSQDLVESIGWLALLFVIVSFLVNGGLAGIKDLQTALGAIERISALVATMLLLIQILLISRVPWLDRLYGHDRATATHKKIGKPVLYLVILHVVAVIWSYSLNDGVGVIDEFMSLIKIIPEILLATISLGLMITVVLASINISRKKLSYEAWYLVHLLGYGAVMFAIPHQLIVGVDITISPITQGFWVAAYLFVGLNILWFRLASPIFLSGTRKLQVGKVVRESTDSVSITINGKKLNAFAAEAGQFFIVRFLTKSHWWRAHPFSLSAKPTNTAFRFTIGKRGDDTAIFQNITPGTKVILEGPYGVFVDSRRTEDEVVLVAAGIGAPPIRALAESLEETKSVNIIYRVRDADDAPLLSELKELSQRKNYKLHVLDGSRRAEDSWLPKSVSSEVSDEQALQRICPSISAADVFICGPREFTKLFSKSSEKLGVPTERIHAEEFAW